VHYLGLISLYLSCAFTLLALYAGTRPEVARHKLARRASSLSVAAVVISTLALVAAFVTSDFRLAYVARNSARSLSLIYKVSGLWAGQSGSLLLWLFIMSLFTIAVQKSRGLREVGLDVPVNVVINSVRLLFMLLLVFVISPFEVLQNPPYNGSGLNPMLQSLGMVVHPPLLFLGFSGFAVPFAVTVAQLWAGGRFDAWLELSRPWALFAWLFLTAGIVTGGQWAYNELGWGGYWAWDPVENASLFPWLTGTALVLTLQLSKGYPGRKVWSYILIVLSFALTIFATFLTRSGVLDSVHAFSGGPLGPIFMAVLAAILIFASALAYWRRGAFRGDGHGQVGFHGLLGWGVQGGVVLLLLLLAGVLFGTMFPLLSRAVVGREIVLDESFFNQVTVPLFLVLFALMALSPVLAKGGRGLRPLLRAAGIPVLLGALTGLYVYVAAGGGLAVSAAFAIAALGLAAHLGSLVWPGEKGFKLGSTAVHVGVLLMLVGVAGSSVFTDEIFISVEPGEVFHFGEYQVGYTGLTTRYGVDRYTVSTTLSLARNGTSVGELASAKTFWENRTQPSTKVGVFSTIKEDLYLNLAGWEGQAAQLHLERFALVSWIWFGAWLAYFGAALSLFRLASVGKLHKQVKARWQRTS
jgi:cytochrome c-type biogenesis protein CcmF